MKTFSPLVLCFAVLLFSACAGKSDVSAIRTETDFFKQLHPKVTVVVEEEDLLDEVQIADIKLRSRGRLKQLAFRFINSETNTIRFKYIVKWEDKEEFPVDGATVWEPLSLTSGMQKNISVIAKSPKADRAIISLKLIK